MNQPTEDDYIRQELEDINATLERVIPEAWGDDASWSSIAVAWIEHMATTHGANCAGPHCAATAEVPAHVAAIRRMWRDVKQYGWNPAHPATGGYRDAIRNLAHELGVDLDA